MNKKNCPYCGSKSTKDELRICEIDGCVDMVCIECIKTHINVTHMDMMRDLEDEEFEEL